MKSSQMPKSDRAHFCPLITAEVCANLVDAAELLDALLQLGHAGRILPVGRLVQLDEQSRMDIGAAIDAAVAAAQNRLRHQVSRPVSTVQSGRWRASASSRSK